MKLLYQNSLAKTLDSINELVFLGEPLTKGQKTEAANWIAARQGLENSYANMFAPTKKDYREGIRVFTGERIRSGAGTGHILGEEACRVLILLNVADVNVQMSLKQATEGMLKTLNREPKSIGTYCCGTCSCALWRHLTAGGLDESERRLKNGMNILRLHRKGDGKWKRFPFYYTLLALVEISLPSARKEMQYAAPVCERYLKRAPRKDQCAQRRRVLVERVLEKC